MVATVSKTFEWKSNNHKLRTETFGTSSGFSFENVLREFISNSIDAKANKIEIEIYKTIINGVEKVIIKDNGIGITELQLKNEFSEIGTNCKRENKTKSIGQFGVGRFSFYSIASNSKWTTISKDKKNKKTFKIEFELDENKMESNPYKIEETKQTETGTQIEIFHIRHNAQSHILKFDTVVSELTSIFASTIISNEYNVDIFVKLYEFEEKKLIESKNKKLDFTEIIFSKQIEEFESSNGIKANISHLVLDDKTKMKENAKISYSDKGVCFKQDSIENSNIATKKYIALVDSPEFNKFVGTSRDDKVSNLYPEFNQFKNEIQELCKEYIKNKNIELKIPFLQIARAKSFYPERFKKEQLNILESANKIIYDETLMLLNDKLEIGKASPKIQKLIFIIVERFLGNNDLAELLDKVIDLSENEIRQFNEMLIELKFNKLSALYESTIGRLKFLRSFEALVYDSEHNKTVKERSQLQPILEKSLWLFKEEYSMSAFDKRISTILDKLLIENKKNNDNELINEKAINPEGLNLIPDFFISSKRYDDLNKQDNFLVVEIKRPIVKLNRDHEDQMMRYIDSLVEQENLKNSKWQFMLISSHIDSSYKKRLDNDCSVPLGTYYKEKGVDLKVLTWTDLINARKHEYNFIVKAIEKDFDYNPAYIKEKYPELLSA
jgi:Histidine kinase-, DNA gyrase B-, and HSP90-like ATPase